MTLRRSFGDLSAMLARSPFFVGSSIILRGIFVIYLVTSYYYAPFYEAKNVGMTHETNLYREFINSHLACAHASIIPCTRVREKPTQMLIT